MKTNNKISASIQKYFVIGILLLLIVLLFLFISPFFLDLVVAAVIVTAVYPAYKLFRKNVKLPISISAFISLVLIVVIILIPFILFTFFIAEEAGEAYAVVSEEINTILYESSDDPLKKASEILPFSDSLQKILEKSPISSSDILKTTGDIMGGVSSFLLGRTTSILKHLSLILIHIVVFLISMFFLLKDGDKLVDYLYSLMPLSENHKKELFKKLKNLSYGIIYGIFGAAILQGVLVGIGFSISGFQNAAFWGAVAALFSPVPYIGTAIIWVPAVIILAVKGHWIFSIFLLIWGVLVVGMSDNFIKPYLIGSKASLHPLSILLVLLGGAFMFGPKGLILGPFILTLTLAFLHIYELDYQNSIGSSAVKKGK